MRVSTNSIYRDYQRNLNDSQFKVNGENLRISSGKKNHSIADNTADVVDADLFRNKISRNEAYLSNIGSNLDRLQQTDTTLREISDKMQEIRDYVVDVSKTSTGYNHFAIGFGRVAGVGGASRRLENVASAVSVLRAAAAISSSLRDSA